MRRFWSKDKLDKHSANPTIHPTLASAFEEANRLTVTRSQGHFAIFECIGCVKLSKQKKKKPACEPALPSGT